MCPPNHSLPFHFMRSLAKPCSPRPHWRCRPWNRRGRTSNRRWDRKLEQPRQQKWNKCPSVSHPEDGILHGEGSPSGSHCSSGPWRGLKWSIGVLGGPWHAKMRWNDADHNFCGLREKMKTGRYVWHGSQRPLRNVPMGPIPDMGTRKNLCEYLLAGFCHRIRLGCLILLIAGATTISQKYGATSIPSNLVY